MVTATAVCEKCGKGRRVIFIKGKPRHRICRECQLDNLHKQNLGEKHPNWKGGKRQRGRGYILIWKPEHPFATQEGYVPEHRLVMEIYLGRFLKTDEIVHHENNDTTDNRIENLRLFATNGQHMTYHKEKRKEIKRYAS